MFYEFYILYLSEDTWDFVDIILNLVPFYFYLPCPSAADNFNNSKTQSVLKLFEFLVVRNVWKSNPKTQTISIEIFHKFPVDSS